MAILETEDGNILDAEAINWRAIVYPVVGIIIVLLGGLGIYYYQQSQRDAQEMEARQALMQATTPEALRQVADQYPKTTQADFALLGAADLAMGKRDFAGAGKDYRRVADAEETDPVLRDSARLGLGAALEADNKVDDAIDAYLTVAHRGKSSPYAPFAYTSAARLYEQKNDHADERKILSEAAGMGGDSPFIKEAANRLKTLDMSAHQPAPPSPPTTP